MPIDDSTRESYDHLHEVEDWTQHPDRQFLEWPAVRSLLPDLDGRRVLDAGCGSGEYDEWLCEQGASVVGVDATESGVRLARERLADADAEFHVHDLEEPLEFLEDDSVDVVLSQLVLDYVADWRPVFAEFARVLRPGGVLVFSAGHPMSGWVNPDEASDYFETEQLTQEWGEHVLYNYRRPLGEHLNPLAEAGFRLEQFLEPTPEPEYREHAPERYERLTTVPRWEIVRASLHE